LSYSSTYEHHIFEEAAGPFSETGVGGFYKGNQNIAAVNFVLEHPTCMWFVDEDV